ncbi:2-hydroxyacyl-CoA dehydratase subunit D [Vermiculatibacterium agrestimuris]|uniref:2-hydroxyacyl-CoA dehydratase subunit D n=1 Tax=Vermiculatibacterium agrestimuris TaxID=2941519 RepID=UPI0020411382|nr:2-hydroxyacyl-CoA dehydratase family protein [Vermiculatibacterium agrestimuris]
MKRTEIIQEMQYALAHIRETVRAKKAAGVKVIGCGPVFVPDELVIAAGAFPVGVWGAEKLELYEAAEYYPPFACSVVQSITELSARGMYRELDGIMLTSLCDTLKCLTQTVQLSAPELKPIFIKHPQNYRLECAVEYMVREFTRAKEQIEELTGMVITEKALEQAIALCERDREATARFTELLAEKPGILTNRQRHDVIKSRLYMDRQRHLELVEALNRELEAAPAPEFRGVRLYACGVMLEPAEILDILDEQGFALVGDELAQETRQLRYRIPEGTSQIERLARQIQQIRGEAFLYDPKKERCDVVVEACRAAGAEAVLFSTMKFCDTDEYDYPWVKAAAEAAGLPVLNLEIEQVMQSFGGIHTRLQAFGEKIRGRR